MTLQPHAGTLRRRMLDQRRDHVTPIGASLDHASDGQVIGLGAPNVKMISSSSQPSRRATSWRVCHGIVGAKAIDVTTGGVAEVLAQVWEHRVDDLWQYRGRGVVIEVDGSLGNHAFGYRNTSTLSAQAAHQPDIVVTLWRLLLSWTARRVTGAVDSQG